jgi:hypothetical protein
MSELDARIIEHWRAELRQPGFCFVPAHQMRASLSARALDQLETFTASWNDLRVDEYMADRGRYRKRRHAVFEVAQDGRVSRLADQPHFQSLNYNAVNGGIARYFAPIDHQITESALFQELLGGFAKLVYPLASDVPKWFAEAHQFRIEPNDTEAGQPTPEGMHRDGVDFVLVLMIGRENIAAGTTTLHNASGVEIGSFTLARPLEAVWIDDHRIFHGVTAVHPKVAGIAARRDVLVLTLKKISADSMTTPERPDAA